MKTKSSFKKEVNFDGVSIVFDNPNGVIDGKRLLLINSLILYANFCGRELRVIFFNSKQGREVGINAYFKKE